MQRNFARTLAALTAAASLGAVAQIANAADHAEAPGTQADLAADIADLYTWHDGAEINAVLTFAGLQPAGTGATYDANVLYGIHIDNDGDQVADHDIWFRFGQNGAGAWGVQVSNLPGGDAVVEGAVETTLDAGNGLQVWAGNADDPFFFDLQGFNDTLATSTVSFDASRDSLAGTNVTGIVVTMDAATAHGGSGTLDVWATSARL